MITSMNSIIGAQEAQSLYSPSLPKWLSFMVELLLPFSLSRLYKEIVERGSWCNWDSWAGQSLIGLMIRTPVPVIGRLWPSWKRSSLRDVKRDWEELLRKEEKKFSLFFMIVIPTFPADYFLDAEGIESWDRLSKKLLELMRECAYSGISSFETGPSVDWDRIAGFSYDLSLVGVGYGPWMVAKSHPKSK